MTVRRHVYIVCDGWDHPEVIENRRERCEDTYEGDGFETVKAAVDSARESGWLIRADGEAICPVCRKLLKRKRRAT